MDAERVPNDIFNFNRITRFFWIFLFVLLVLAFCIRCYYVLSEHPGAVNLFAFFAMFPLTYFLFIYEGLHDVASYLHSVDRDGINDFISQNYSEPKLSYVRAIVSLLQTEFSNFIAGRQICILVIVVLLAKCIEYTDVSNHVSAIAAQAIDATGVPNLTAHAASQQDATTNSSAVDFHSFLDYFDIRFLANNFFVTLALSTLLPCWIAQILPEMIASRRTTKFLSLFWPCLYLSRFAIAVSKAGAAFPGALIFSILRDKLYHLRDLEIVSIGKTTIYERSSTSLGQRSPHRSIKLRISKDNFQVEDECCVEYISGAKTKISHVLRVYLPHSKDIVLIDAEGKVPPVKQSPWRSRTLAFNTVSPIDNRDISSEILFSLDTTLALPIPRKPNSPESTEFKFVYKADSLSLREDIFSSFYFDISKPTKRLDIEIICEDGLFVVDPTMKRQPIDELLVLGEHALEVMRKDVDFSISIEGRSVSIRIDYPSVAHRYVLELDAREESK